MLRYLESKINTFLGSGASLGSGMSGCLAMSGREKLSAHLPRYREFFFLDPRDVCFLNNPTPTGTLRRLSCSDGHKYRRGFSSGNGVVQVAMTERWLLVVCGGRISPGRSRPPKWPGGIFPGRAQRTWQEAEGTAEEVFSVTWYPFRTIGGYILWTSAHGTKVQVSFLQSFCEEDCGLHWPTPILLACGNPTFFLLRQSMASPLICKPTQDVSFLNNPTLNDA